MKDELVKQHPLPNQFSEFWLLDPEITFLNHGSFGACPVPVLEAQNRWRERIERQPFQFFARDLEGLLDAALSELAAFVGADPADLVFVPNATTGINTVLKSLQFEPGDELLTTNQEYNACRNALNYVAERFDLRIVVADVPFPIQSPEMVIEAVTHCVSSRTRLALLDHVVSQTGLVFPIAQLIQIMTQRGIETLIDGAHAPGMVPLNLRQLGATYYTGNCHKWLCAPKGAAFLYVQRDRQSAIRPLTISHGANSPRRDRSQFRLEFDWIGTVDPTSYLCVPEAIQFMGSLLANGWSELMAKNRTLALTVRRSLHEGLNLPLSCPDEMVGSMAVLPLPDGNPQKLQDELLNRYQIEVPVIPYPNPTSRKVRISAQLYNYLEQYEYLLEALTNLLDEEKKSLVNK